MERRKKRRKKTIVKGIYYFLGGLLFLLSLIGSTPDAADAQAFGQISANPNPVVLPVGTIIGNTTISWSTFNSP